MRQWLVVCERTGDVSPIAETWIVYDRRVRRWLIVSSFAKEELTDYSIRAIDLIGTGPEHIDMLLHVKEKTWFVPDDFVAALSRAFRQIVN